MKVKAVIGVLLGVVALVLAGVTIFLCFSCLDTGTVLLEKPANATTLVTRMMDAVCAGDYETVTAVVYGHPEMGVDREPEDAVSLMIWKAFRDSFTYELVGELYATDSGVAQNIRVTYMDIGSVTANLRQYSQELLNQRVESAQDVSQIYDENNEYRESFVMDVLYDAAKIALEKDAKNVTREFTANLIYYDGQWWITPDDGLMAAISGGIVQ